MYRNTYRPTSPRVTDQFAPSVVRAALSKGPEAKFAQQFLADTAAGFEGDKEGNKSVVTSNLKQSFGVKIAEMPYEIDPKELTNIMRTIKVLKRRRVKPMRALGEECSVGARRLRR
eukprot:854638-Prorocentrum_minimum.AAC.1